jgi:hypothetical protein
MRAILHRSSLPAFALAGAMGLLLAACQTDTLTNGAVDDGANVPPVTFAPVAGAHDAVAASTRRLVRTLTTLQLRGATPAGLGASAGANVDSPWDLTYVGGPLVTRATSWNVYVNCATTAAKCWGTGSLSPATFLRDLNRSSFIGVVNQYLGVSAAGRFAVNELSTTAAFATDTATIDDVLNIVYSASTFTKASGYTNIFHVFLPQGTDMCISPGLCYSPDNPESFVFCAFHGSIDFGPNQHVLFSVEPYQDVDGCRLTSQTPHGVIDATASTLSHEFIETITDPDLDAWFNLLTGNEIADLCFAFASNQRMGVHAYSIQEEYSNAVHGCTDGT